MSAERSAAPFAVRAYRALLRLAPSGFRAHHAESVVHVFESLVRDAAADNRPAFGLRLLVAELPGVARLLWIEWRDALLEQRPTIPSRRKDSMLSSIAQDLRGATRALRRSPGFAAVAILTLALGVGANTAIFSLVEGVLLRPLDFPRSDRLVALGAAGPQGAPMDISSTSPGNFFDWKRGARSASGLAAYFTQSLTLTGLGDAQSLIVTGSGGGLFDVLAEKPLVGRTIRREDEQFGAEPVVVLSHHTWTELFGQDRSVVGQRLTIDGHPTTVIGVMPAGFRFPDASTDAWTPFAWTPEFRANRDQYFLGVVGRLADGATIERLRAEMTVTAAMLRRDFSQYNTDLSISVLPLQEVVVQGARGRLLLFMGAVGFVLLITCANLANLLLARAAVRRREMAVRHALGAGRGRITRQLLTESLALSAAGGVAALGVGQLLLRWLVAAHREILPRIEDVRLDAGVIAFTFGIALIGGLAFGLAPALQLASAQSAQALRESDRAGGVRVRGRHALVVTELALALVLLVGAGLLIRSAVEASRIDPGFDPRRLLTFTISLGRAGSAKAEEALDRLRAIPGVQSASVVSQLPITGRGVGAWFNMYSRPVAAGQTPPGEAYRVVSPDYFQTVGIRLLRGRLLTLDDRRASSPSVVVNEALARKYWPDASPIGEEIYLGAPDNRLFDRATIVGVVADTRDAGLRSKPIPEVFIPHGVMTGWPFFAYVIRTTGDPTAVVSAVRAVMRDLVPNAPLYRVRTMGDIMRDSAAGDRLALALLGTLAAVAVLMAALGVFGVLAYVVAQRRRELGIRVALGATVDDVRRLVVVQGLRMAVIGVAMGLAGAVALSSVMNSLVYGIRSTDPLTYSVVALLLLVIAMMASWIPARRATRVDPMVALRD